MKNALPLSTINFKYWITKYPWNEHLQVYSNKNIVLYSKFKGNCSDCEKEILKLVSKQNHSDTDILEVIDLINQWGGKTSRMFYSSNHKNNFNSPRERIKKNLKLYKEGISASKAIDYSAFDIFKKIYGISYSFSGKHAMFWSKFNLIVVDNKISGVFGYKNPSSLFKRFKYEEILNESIKVRDNIGFDSVTMVERALFAFHVNYFNNSNTDFKENIIDFTDLDIAYDIANNLKIEIPKRLKKKF